MIEANRRLANGLLPKAAKACDNAVKRPDFAG
jgi:hypothetical protein